ncbi:ABC transporter ATP-binding protein [Oscillospiraceae bacterium PP1C4]
MIQINNLRKSYGSKTALQGLDITIQKGEIVGLLGLNGAGKSTTMNIMTGCLSATEGTVLIDGIDIAKDPLKAKKKIGYLPENPPLYTDMKVIQYLEFICDLKKVKGNKREHLLTVCERVGILDVKNRLIKNLSKGYRQRVGLAQALINNPPILILDEPTVGLDPTQIIEIRNLIEQMGKERTVILSSHILSEIQAVCKRVIVIDQGQVVADDTPESLEAALQNKNSCIAVIEGDDNAVQETLLNVQSIEKVTRLSQIEDGVFEYEVLGAENTDIRRPMFFALAQAQMPLLATRNAQVSLEDVFLQLVGTEQKAGGKA